MKIKKLLKSKKVSNKGITLIALVITIVVLLILAGVSIAMLTGENGILTQANKAKQDTEIGEEKEQIRLAYNAAKIAAIVEGKSVTATGLNAEFVTNGVNATASGSNPIKVKFNETGREYTIDSNGIIIGPTEGGNQEVGYAPVIDRVEYTKSGNTFNLNTVAYDIEPLDEQYIGELTIAEGATYGFEQKEDGTIVSEDVENPEGTGEMPAFANSYIKVDLTNVEEDVIANIEITTSSFDQCGAMSVTESTENIMNIMPEIIMKPKETKEYTLNLEAGKENYIHFGYIYAGKDEENEITDSLTINKMEIKKKITDSELAYKYTVNGIEQENNVITMDTTKLQGQDAVKVDNVVQTPKVPVGFSYLEGTKEEGYVITDIDQNYIVEVEVTNSVGKTATATREITGNEFVWVPVDNFEEFEREHFGTESQKWWAGTFVSDELSANNMYEPEADGEANATEVEKMYKSVKYNGGFYIGRYEAGNEGGTLIYDVENDYTKWDNNGQLVVKKNTQVYNYIGWADTNDMDDETGGAVELARNFATENGYNTAEVNSTLCYGVQWDAVMRWISKDNSLKGYLTDSTGKGNYSENLIKTGSNENYEMKNIYDMAGNVKEWTMESYDTGSRVDRGGYYDNDGAYNPVSNRGYTFPSDTYGYLGFRLALYL